VSPGAPERDTGGARGNQFAQEQLAARDSNTDSSPSEGRESRASLDWMTGGPSTDNSEASATAGVGAFAALFSEEFQSVLHVLGGQGAGGALTDADVERLFSAEQQAKLSDFMTSSHPVPVRLFNGVANSAALTPQRRILMSSYILEVGTFDPSAIGAPAPETAEESVPAQDEAPTRPPPSTPDGDTSGPSTPQAPAPEAGRADGAESETASGGVTVGANSCRHWAMMVYAYAGLPVPGEGVDGQWHTHDPTGAIALGGSTPQSTRGSLGSAGGVDRSQRWAPMFGPGVQAADLFHPGDWLQIAWSGGGGHSVVLSEVKSETRTRYDIEYFSQYRNDDIQEGTHSARRRETKTLNKTGRGDVVFGHTPMSQAEEADSAEELLPGMGGLNRRGGLRSGGINQRYIERRLGLRPSRRSRDWGGVSTWLCAALARLNEGRIDALGARITELQRAQLSGVNGTGDGEWPDVERLVRLNQRVANILVNDAAVVANARRDDASPHFRPGRSAGDGLKEFGSSGGLGVRRAATRNRHSGLLQDIADVSQVNWGSCPTPQ